MRNPEHAPEPNQRDDAESSGSTRRLLPTADSFEIERVETTPMTPEQYETAVSTLAALIAEWLRNNPTEIDDQAA
jgi:hypothetical protein